MDYESKKPALSLGETDVDGDRKEAPLEHLPAPGPQYLSGPQEIPHRSIKFFSVPFNVAQLECFVDKMEEIASIAVGNGEKSEPKNPIFVIRNDDEINKFLSDVNNDEELSNLFSDITSDEGNDNFLSSVDIEQSDVLPDPV